MATFDSELKFQLHEKLSQGRVPQWILTDPDVYVMEIERVFANTWYFLGHETEIPNPGDYVSRWYVNDPVILTRDENQKIRAFMNSCMHRGTILCSADFGNKANFVCPYHGWTYSLEGELTGIIAGDKIYGSEMDRSEWKLRELPRLESYHGLIFASLNENVANLDEYLGNLKWYFDILIGRSDKKMQVKGVPFRWVVNANWKIGSDNFGGDAYHTAMTHRSTVELGIAPKDPMFASYGHQVVLDNGHGLNVITPSPVAPKVPPFQGLPEVMWPMFERNLSESQLEVFRNTAVVDGTCFPNLSFLSPMHGTGGHAHLTNFLTLRQWRPLGPDKMEIWSWFLADIEAPEEFVEESYKRYVNTFGPSGVLEQDDTEIWSRITSASKGLMARDKTLSYDNVMNYVMGMDSVKPDSDWPGPGTAYPTCYLEAVQRGFYEKWYECITKE